MILQILISGFTQHRGYAHGWYKLRETLLSEGYSDGAKQRVWLEPWSVNTKRLAGSIQILQGLYGELEIGLYAYSYGGGHGAMQLLKNLDQINIDVSKVVLADPVFRPSWLPAPLPSPLSLLPFDYQPKIRLPKNVIDLKHFYQNRNVPQSPYLITDQVQGNITHTKLGVTHQEMDDHPDVHLAVLQSATELRRLVTEQNDSDLPPIVEMNPDTVPFYRAA